MFNATNSNAIISKSWNIFWIFFSIFAICIKFGIVWKKRWDSEVIFFWYEGFQKARLLKCLKACVRTLTESQHVKRDETLLKYSREYFCHISWSLSKNVNSKHSILVVCEMMRLFVNILTTDDKYSLWAKASV